MSARARLYAFLSPRCARALSLSCPCPCHRAAPSPFNHRAAPCPHRAHTTMPSGRVRPTRPRCGPMHGPTAWDVPARPSYRAGCALAGPTVLCFGPAQEARPFWPPLSGGGRHVRRRDDVCVLSLPCGPCSIQAKKDTMSCNIRPSAMCCHPVSI